MDKADLPIGPFCNKEYPVVLADGGHVCLLVWRGLIVIKRLCDCNVQTYFRSMLYNGSDVIRDLEWVIFDEVHYINDAEVSEFVFLSCSDI